jgi:putative transposase
VHHRLRCSEGPPGSDHHGLGAGGGADLHHRACSDTFRYAPGQHWDEPAKDLRPVDTAATEAAAWERFASVRGQVGSQAPGDPPVLARRPGRVRSVPGRGHRDPLRSSGPANAIESLNARCRRAVKARGHFPNGAAALKCLYLATRSLDPTGRGRARWATEWKPALNALATAFEGRINSPCARPDPPLI